jgi:prevent-host-death family protein
MAMKQVGVAALKARLSEYLREVRRGRTLTVLDRDTPIAQVVPYPGEAVALRVRRPRGDAPLLRDIPLPPPLTVEVDVVALLLEERHGER